MAALLRSTSLVGELLDEVEQCLARYRLRPPPGPLAVALSGGVDSWAALALLAELRRLGRLDAELTAIHIDLGFDDGAARRQTLADGCAAAGVELTVVQTTIGPAALAAKRKRPCFLCARRRRQALLEEAARAGVACIVTGHHRDDVLASFLLNLLENREISALAPAQPLFDGRFTLLRPLYATPKERILKLSRQQRLPVVALGCPLDGATRRQTAAELLDDMERRFPGARRALFTALHRPKTDFLPREWPAE